MTENILESYPGFWSFLPTMVALLAFVVAAWVSLALPRIEAKRNRMERLKAFHNIAVMAVRLIPSVKATPTDDAEDVVIPSALESCRRAIHSITPDAIHPYQLAPKFVEIEILIERAVMVHGSTSKFFWLEDGKTLDRAEMIDFISLQANANLDVIKAHLVGHKVKFEHDLAC